MPNVKNIELITQECKKHGLTKLQACYVLATAQHETNNTFEPVREAYWLGENWRKNNLRYYPYYGRGYVQLTWKFNYAKYNKVLGLTNTNDDLVKNPDVVMREPVSRFILVHGSKNGVFTGKKLSDFINENKTDFINARRVINGTDKAALIARYAQAWIKSKEIKEVYDGETS